MVTSVLATFVLVVIVPPQEVLYNYHKKIKFGETSDKYHSDISACTIECQLQSCLLKRSWILEVL